MFDLAGDLKALAEQAAGGVPVVILQDENDRIAPREDAGDALVTAYPDQARLVIVSDAGARLVARAA